MREARLTADLPERFGRLYNHHTERFETPLDNQGIADIDATFELAIRTYPDELPTFEHSERNIHHIYWTKSWWHHYAKQHNEEDEATIIEFRNSTPQLAYVPLPLHGWIEEVMVPPPPPPLEVMRRRNAAWVSASLLLRSANHVDAARDKYKQKAYTPRTILKPLQGITPVSKCKELDSEQVIDQEYWLGQLQRQLKGWKQLAHFHDEVPQEFRFVPDARLTCLRALRRRIKKGAIVPRVPSELLAS